MNNNRSKQFYKQNEEVFLNDLKKVKFSGTLPSVKTTKTFIKNITTSQVCVLGETHGIKESVQVYYDIIKLGGFTNIGLEWDKKLEPVLNKYIRTGKLDFKKIQDSPDGRITAGHFALFRELVKQGYVKRVFCFDQWDNDWDKRDLSMAKNIESNLINNQKTLIISGLTHTQNSPKFGGVTYTSLVDHLQKKHPKLVVARVQFKRGYYQNFGKKKITPAKAKKTKSKVINLIINRSAHPAIVPFPQVP